MDINVSIKVYEGPLDLLLSLIDKNKIDIYDIPIHTVTEQFLYHIRQWEELNLEVASDFILMATTLLEIKSRMLLPVQVVEIDGEEVSVDPREELVRRLLEYKLFKEIADDLKSSEAIYSRVYYKPGEDVSDYRDPFDELSTMKLTDLMKTFEGILERYRYNTGDPSFFEIQREEISLEQCSEDITNRLILGCSIKFSDIIRSHHSRSRIIAYFLSLLELLRMRMILVTQDDTFSDLLIEKRG